MPSMKHYLPVLILPLLGPCLFAQIVQDDFNDGNDAGWERYSPLAPLGHLSHSPFLKGTVTGYRLQPLPIQGHLDLPEGDLIVRTWSMKPSGWRLTS